MNRPGESLKTNSAFHIAINYLKRYEKSIKTTNPEP